MNTSAVKLKPKKIKSWAGYDAAGNIEEITSGRVKYFDLTKPRYLGKTFDWVTTFEVGEHIPVQFERIFFENLIRHAREGIVISWALPCNTCP
jgi:tryptophanyl-tRNA synthetase